MKWINSVFPDPLLCSQSPSSSSILRSSELLQWYQFSSVLSVGEGCASFWRAVIPLLAAIPIRTVAPKKQGVWERGFTDVKATMEDLVNKLQQRLETTNKEVNDSLRDILDALKAQDEKMQAVSSKTDLLEQAVQDLRADSAEAKAAFHTTPPSTTDSPAQGEGLLHRPPAPPPQRLPLAARPQDTHPGHPDSPRDGEPRRGWVPKMDFPKFDGSKPAIWADQCVGFFRLYQVHESLWVTAATINMVDNAALWLQAYKVEHTLSDWDMFLAAVFDEFGADEHEAVLLDLMQLRQTDTVDAYWHRFGELKYQLRVHDPGASEKSMVLQFLHGLRDDIRASVELHAPATVAKAAALARKQEQIVEHARRPAPRGAAPARAHAPPQRPDPPPPPV